MKYWNNSSPGEHVLHRPYLLFLLVCCIAIGCTPTPEQVVVAPTDTLQGPIVPTRAPTTTSEAVTQINDATAELPPTVETEPTVTPTEPTAVANLPTDAPTDTSEPPTSTNTAVEPTITPTKAATTAPTETDIPTDTPTDIPTNTPTDTPTDTPTHEPTPTTQPTDTAEPTNTPSETPTDEPTDTPEPTKTNTPEPTIPPTSTPAPTAVAVALVGEPYTNSTAFLPATVEEQVAAFADVSGRLDDRNPARLYVYQGVGGEILNIAMRALDDTLDPSLLVLDPEGREITRNEDEHLETLDAAIHGLRLGESGAYIIVATRYGQQFGFSSGDFELSVTKGSGSTTPLGFFTQPIEYGDDVTAAISEDIPAYIYTFRGESGDVVSIQMTATSGDLDSRLFLTDNLGNTLAANDDDLLNLNTNSYIQEFILPASGYYSIIASHYMGAPNSGDFELSLRLEESGTPGEIHPIYAVLNIENSRTLRSDGQFFSNYSAGDNLGEDGNEYRLDTLLTFYLPPLPQGASLDSATLELAPCYEAGSGFQALGPLSVFVDDYGSFAETSDFTRPSAGANVLTEMSDCDALDLTDLVNEAYGDDSQIQLRLTFRDPTANRQGDEVYFTPRLLLNLSE